MAITINFRPQILMPTYNKVGMSCISSNQTNEKFQMIYDLYSASTSSRFFRDKSVVDPAGYCKSNFQSILKNYLSYDLSPSSTGVTTSVNSRFNYDIQIGEEYVYNWPFYDNFAAGTEYPTSGYSNFVGFSATTQHYFSIGDRVFIDQAPGYTQEAFNGVHTVFGVPDSYSIVISVAHTTTPVNPGTATYSDSRTTKFTNLKVISGLTVNNAAFSHIDWLSYAVNNYNLTAGTAMFFCDAPAQYEMSDNSRAWINFYSTSGTAMSNFVVETFAQNGTSLGMYNNVIGTGTLNEKYYKVGVGPWNLSNTPFTVTSGLTSVINSNVETYKVWIEDSFKNLLTEKREFKLDHRCSKYGDSVSICFLDRKGSFISKEFQLGRTYIEENNKKEFKKPTGSFNGSNFTYNTFDRGITVYDVDVTQKFTANSNWISEPDADYLREIFSSPEVYWNNNGEFLPIIITNKFYKIPSITIDHIFNVAIDFEMAFRNPINI